MRIKIESVKNSILVKTALQEESMTLLDELELIYKCADWRFDQEKVERVKDIKIRLAYIFSESE